MSYAYVGGNSNSVSSGSSLTISYASTAGNLLFCALFVISSSVSSVKDSHNTAWNNIGGVGSSVALYYLMNSPAITSVTVNWTGSSAATAVVAEYSGFTSLVGNFLSHSTGTVDSWSLSKTLGTSTDWLVAGGAIVGTGTPSVSSSTGNLRIASSAVGTAPDVGIALIVDNTGTGSVVCSPTVTGQTGVTDNQAYGAEFA